MSKRLTKPHVINDRLETPTGLIGVPPEAAIDGGTGEKRSLKNKTLLL